MQALLFLQNCTQRLRISKVFADGEFVTAAGRRDRSGHLVAK